LEVGLIQPRWKILGLQRRAPAIAPPGQITWSRSSERS